MDTAVAERPRIREYGFISLYDTGFAGSGSGEGSPLKALVDSNRYLTRFDRDMVTPLVPKLDDEISKIATDLESKYPMMAAQLRHGTEPDDRASWLRDFATAYRDVPQEGPMGDAARRVADTLFGEPSLADRPKDLAARLGVTTWSVTPEGILAREPDQIKELTNVFPDLSVRAVREPLLANAALMHEMFVAEQLERRQEAARETTATAPKVQDGMLPDARISPVVYERDSHLSPERERLAESLVLTMLCATREPETFKTFRDPDTALETARSAAAELEKNLEAAPRIVTQTLPEPELEMGPETALRTEPAPAPGLLQEPELDTEPIPLTETQPKREIPQGTAVAVEEMEREPQRARDEEVRRAEEPGIVRSMVVGSAITGATTAMVFVQRPDGSQNTAMSVTVTKEGVMMGGEGLGLTDNTQDVGRTINGARSVIERYDDIADAAVLADPNQTPQPDTNGYMFEPAPEGTEIDELEHDMGR